MDSGFRYTPILGWSVSRFDTFQSCKRRYYYQYYGRHDPHFSVLRINQLKNLTTVPMATGAIAHEVIKLVLDRLRKSTEDIDRDRLAEFTRGATLHHCASSAFTERHYGAIESVDTSAICGYVNQSLDNLLRSSRFAWIRDTAVRYHRNWIVDPPGYGETRIDGMKAYVKIDFLTPTNDGLLVIDWKTGQQHPEKHRRQLEAYACWASMHFDHEPAQVSAILAYLSPVYHEDSLPAGDVDVDTFLERFSRETQEMYDYCVDVENNLPRDKEAFARTHNRLLCSSCNFRELCAESV